MNKNHGLGLMRLVLQVNIFYNLKNNLKFFIFFLFFQHNKFNSDNENYGKLLELLKTRDPFYKPPINSELAETLSIHSGKESALGKHKLSTSKH